MKEPAQKVVLNKKSDNTIADPEEFRSELEKRIGNLVSSAQKEKILEAIKASCINASRDARRNVFGAISSS